MLRMFLAPPRPLLANFRRLDHHSVARQLGRCADQMISRSYTSSEDETDGDVDLPEAKHRRKHLYVVLDDWKKGFSIHKLDLDNEDGGDLTLRAPVHRQSTGNRYWNFAAVGSKIVAAGRIKSEEDDHGTLVYDTETAGLSIVPRLPEALHGQRWYLAAAVGNGLYTANTDVSPEMPHGSMHLFEDAPAPETHDKYWWGSSDHWSWRSILTPLPFCVHDMESSAVHPEGGGHTLFMSVGKWNKIADVRGRVEIGDDQDLRVHPVVIQNGYIHTSQTFSYDTGNSEWRRHGEWDLPFCGQAHYDDELDAWVGLQKITRDTMTSGYLCSCDVASPYGAVQPAWKLSSMRLFDPDTWSHIGASLLYMGGSNYCLVEVMALESFTHNHCTDIGNKCVIRVATFCLKYDKKGELIVTARRPDRAYLFSRFYKNSEVPAFWM